MRGELVEGRVVDMVLMRAARVARMHPRAALLVGRIEEMKRRGHPGSVRQPLHPHPAPRRYWPENRGSPPARAAPSRRSTARSPRAAARSSGDNRRGPRSPPDRASTASDPPRSPPRRVSAVSRADSVDFPAAILPHNRWSAPVILPPFPSAPPIRRRAPASPTAATGAAPRSWRGAARPSSRPA